MEETRDAVMIKLDVNQGTMKKRSLVLNSNDLLA